MRSLRKKQDRALEREYRGYEHTYSESRYSDDDDDYDSASATSYETYDSLDWTPAKPLPDGIPRDPSDWKNPYNRRVKVGTFLLGEAFACMSYHFQSDFLDYLTFEGGACIRCKNYFGKNSKKKSTCPYG